MSAPATEPMRWPTLVEPVKLTMSTCFEATSASAGPGASETMMLMTPGGKPASWNTSPSFTMPSGSCGAGFTTTVLPMASAGPSLPAMFVIGKLYEVMHVTTPTGARRAMPPMIPPAPSAVVGMTAGGIGSCCSASMPLA